jgi:hypothetical protein
VMVLRRELVFIDKFIGWLYKRWDKLMNGKSFCNINNSR